ncbi:UDP-glucose dehydrogenase family protein [Ichthyobacterium seriolicida]|uniref:UDP-glucose 6-dehydrogenase n=1 Tax=Ichthyobacterium seriolicida TaxID=242600 RepID=A0A1J1DYY3_9FLAO|nr:UDP-glucose/GDP-mannose dehydrogenase family protein [Ichthyobacterium seriolicida]BAV95127.1 UDP-glucose 6-dehydrogenase [Ichthyobacterium seriolicida]
MNIAVIGTGYVGLVTGTCLAETGNNVVCVDIDKEKIEKMQNRQLPIYEPNLDILFNRNIKMNRLKFTSSLENAIREAQIIFLALPTPANGDNSADISYVLKVSEEIGKLVCDYKLIVNKSTVPIGTTKKVYDIISKNAKSTFDVVSNPEFLREGFAVNDFLRPDRIIIGTSSDRAFDLMSELYKPYVHSENQIIKMDEKSSELTKYACNSFLATKISFINEMANFCDEVGADIDLIRIGMSADERIGKHFLFSGLGYGGSCFPKDLKALIKLGQDNNYDFKIINAISKVNEKQRTSILLKLEKYFRGDIKGKSIALWGLSFKPDTDDIREAPSLYIIDKLLELGVSVRAFDPVSISNAKKIYNSKIYFATDIYDCVKDVDALIIATEWASFKNPDLDKMKSIMKNPAIFDGRNIYDLKHMQKNNFHYESIGRKKIEI